MSEFVKLKKEWAPREEQHPRMFWVQSSVLRTIIVYYVWSYPGSEQRDIDIYIYIYFFFNKYRSSFSPAQNLLLRSSHLSDLISLSQCTTLSYLWFASATWVSFLFLEQSKYAAISRPLCLGFLLGMQKTLHFLFQWWGSHEEDFEARSGISHAHNHCLM